MGHRSRLFAALLLLSALALRLGYIHEHGASPFFDAPVVDARTFIDQARAIAGGDLAGGPEPYWQPPLYIYLLALVCWLLPDSYFVGIRLLQALFGAVSCLLVYGLARRAFGEPAGRIAGCAAALCGTFLYFEGELLAVPLEVFLNLLLLQRLLRAMERDRGLDWGLAGLTAGLAALARPNVLLFAVLFCAWHLWRRRPAGALAPFAGCALLVILSVTLRNRAAEPGLVLVSANGGVNFYIGNNADYDRTVGLRPGMEWEELVAEPGRAGHATAAAKSSFFLRKGLAWIVSHPLDYLELLGRKTFHFWSGPEIKRNQDVYYARRHSWILSLLLWDRRLSVPFGLIGPLGLLGLGLSLRVRGDPTALLRLYALSYTASVLLFFPAARYRMPVLPVLIAFAALAAWRLWASLRRRSWPEAARLGAPLAALLVVCNATRATPTEEDAQLQFDLGEVHLRKGMYALSEDHSRRALELDPGYNYARHNLAAALFHQGRYEASARTALETLAENPRRVDTHVLLARVQLALERPRQARVNLRRALELDPGSGLANYEYGRLLYDQGDYAGAAERFRRALPSRPEDFRLHYQLGRALHQAGQTEAALARYQRALALERRPEALVAIGALRLVAGRREGARSLFLEALEIDPDNPEAHVNLAVIDVEEGRLHAAVERLRQVLARGPSPQARGLLEEATRRMRSGGG